MKRFFFREMLLASFKDRKARRIQFDPDVTIVRGENETGKSSLLKSLFRTFGAEPAKVHPNWIDADVRSVVRFELDGVQHGILRHNNNFTVFNAKDAPIGRFRSVTNEVGPYFARLFSFGLRLPNQQGVFTALPPAFYFLPYYMDQDGSWTASWAAFAKLKQFSNWKKGVLEYHAGIRGNEYYETQARKLEAENELEKSRRKKLGLQEIYDSLSTRFEAAQFNVDFTIYKAELEELLRRCDQLRAEEETYKARLSELRNKRQSLKTQLDIATHAREESRRDLDHAHAVEGDDVQCPTCGAEYSNDFAERFAIAVDEDYCASLVVTLGEEIHLIDQKIAHEQTGAEKLGGERAQIEKLLAKHEGEVALSDLIRQEGRNELKGVMLSDISALEEEEGTHGVRVTNSEAKLKQLDSRERRKEVNAYYEERMQRFLQRLDVHSVSDAAVKKLDAPLKDTGSELPRALLAYQIAFLHVIEKFGTSARAPLVIDSPNQQDQDPKHIVKMLEFIRNERPPQTQMILGLVDTAGISFGGTEIMLDRKHSLLSEEDFDQVGPEVQGFIDRSLESPT
jgi:hypothetical protein